MKRTRTALRYVPVSMQNGILLLFTDESFDNSQDLGIELVFVVLLADGHDKANIIHYAPSRCRRVTPSKMYSELHFPTCGFNTAYVIQDLQSKLKGLGYQIESFIDSKKVFGMVAKQGRTTEKRLHIEGRAIRESYTKGGLSILAWVPGLTNPVTHWPRLEAWKNRRLPTSWKIKISPNMLGWATVTTQTGK